MKNDNSEKLDQLIARVAKDYNEPRDVPRDEIWNRVVEARRAGAGAAARNRRRPGVWLWPGVGVAAAGLIAVGVMMGRRIERSSQADRAPSRAIDVARANDSAVGNGRSPSLSESVATKKSSDNPSTPSPRREVTAGPTTPAPSGQTGGASIAYRLAVLDHIAGSEAMIMAFRSSARRGDVDAGLAKWSRDLLGETRLLESSAPPDDPTMKRLLEDLELVLAQIVQYTNRGTHSPEDLDLIERSIRHRAVLSNIRNLSAGGLPSGT